MTRTFLASDKKNSIQRNLYLVALTTGKVIWTLPFLVALVAAIVIVSPVWLTQKINLMLSTNSNLSSKEIYINE